MMQAGHVICLAPTGWSLILPISLPGFVAVLQLRDSTTHSISQVMLASLVDRAMVNKQEAPRGPAPWHGTDGAGVREQERCVFRIHLLGALGGSASQSMP